MAAVERSALTVCPKHGTPLLASEVCVRCILEEPATRLAEGGYFMTAEAAEKFLGALEHAPDMVIADGPKSGVEQARDVARAGTFKEPEREWAPPAHRKLPRGVLEPMIERILDAHRLMIEARRCSCGLFLGSPPAPPWRKHVAEKIAEFMP